MISFIAIGRNIEFTAERCIESIIRFASENSIKHFEIIYVDSDSTDNTIALLKKYPITIFQIKGDVNAAIARNTGAKYASGNVLFFIDGDMEIVPEFFKIGFKNESELTYPFITGDFTDIVYNELQQQVDIRDKHKETEPKYMPVVGGLFIIEKKEWDKAGGMDNRLIRHQDFDFGLRMAKMGMPNYRYPNLLAYHHTVSYFSNNRVKDFLFSMKLMSYGLLIRKHIKNKHFIERFVKSRKALIILVLSLTAFIISWKTGAMLLVAYFMFQLLKVYKRRNDGASLKNIFLFNLIFDLYTLGSIVLYHPKDKKFEIIQIQPSRRPL